MSKIKSFQKFLESKGDKFTNYKKLNINEFQVLLGKDAKSNDWITFQMAEEDDIWLHVKGYPGSHVIIKLSEITTTKEKSLPTEDIIRQVAGIAKKNSKAKDLEEVTVVWCLRKFVKKKPGMKDGQVEVDYQNANEIIIRN